MPIYVSPLQLFYIQINVTDMHALMSSSWLWSARDELPERWTLVYLWGYLLFILLQYRFFLRFINQSLFFSFPFFLLPICRALHLGYLFTDLHVKRKWQIRWFLLSIRKSSSCKETNHVISVGAISLLIYKPKMKLIDYCIDMDSLNDEKKITSTCYISLEHLYFWTSNKQN